VTSTQDGQKFHRAGPGATAKEKTMDNDITSETGRTSNAHERIERTAARLKEGTSNAVSGAKEKFDAAADRVESGLHRATDAGARGAGKAADKAGEWRARGSELASRARDRTDDALENVRDFVREKPVQSVAIALAAGWLIGRLLGPRR
jgi:ElaB/YqjD/DUF883 family membrane-anchored ribosome-binding protein